MLTKHAKEKTLIDSFLCQLNVEGTGFVRTTIYKIRVTWVGRMLADGTQVLDYVETDRVDSAKEVWVDGLGTHDCNVQWRPDQSMHEIRAIEIFNERRRKEPRFDSIIKRRAEEALNLKCQEILSRRLGELRPALVSAYAKQEAVLV